MGVKKMRNFFQIGNDRSYEKQNHVLIRILFMTPRKKAIMWNLILQYQNLVNGGEVRLFLCFSFYNYMELCMIIYLLTNDVKFDWFVPHVPRFT